MEVEFFGGDTELVLKSGKKVRIPKLTWRRQVQALRSVSQILGDVKDVDIKSLDSAGVLHLVQVICERGPDKVTTLVSKLTDLKKERIEEDFEMEDIFAVLLPFFLKFLTSFRAVADKVAEVLPKLSTSSPQSTDGQ